jgi:hypothetical protein
MNEFWHSTGLVALGERRHLERLLERALEDTARCSSEPRAPCTPPPCDACLFASETSCEVGNRWLDRAVLVDLTHDGLAFRI